MKNILERSLTASEFHEILEYCSETGIFRWKERPLSSFPRTKIHTQERNCQIWNARFAGTIAGNRLHSGYIRVCIAHTSYLAHRLAWLAHYGKWPNGYLDHINTNRHDNRIANLREATASQNNANKNMRRSSKSGRKGVSWDRTIGKWQCGIGVNGKQIKIGSYNSLDEAALAYEEAAKKYFGEYARV